MKIPSINKKNYKKILRELDIAQYPSMPENLKVIQKKLIKKESLTVFEDVSLFAKLQRYFIDTQKELNGYYLDQFDWDSLGTRQPFEFQKEGIRFLALNDKCIQADDMGLGKTIQAIVATKIYPDDWKILVITLKSLKYNFAKEIDFYDKRYVIVDKEWKTNKYTIVHYDSVKKWKSKIVETDWDVIIIDEAHKIKNQKSQRSQNIKLIFKELEDSIKKIWLLTGTPIANRPSELFQLLTYVKHPITKNWIDYVKKYCNGYKDIWDRWQTGGSSNLEDLYEKTKNSIIRRLKTNVLVDFPNKFRTPIFLELDNFKKYYKVLEDYKNKKYELEDLGDFKKEDLYINDLTKFVLYRQYCAFEKVESGITLELIENEIDKGNKVIVATGFTKVIRTLYDKLGDKICNYIDGSIKDPAKRQEIVDDFNINPEKQVILLNYQAGGTGYNIQSANSIVINDMALKPDDISQVEDRSWRIGQKRDVESYFPIYKGTVEEALYYTIIEKNKIATTVIDGEEKHYFENNDSKPIQEMTQKDLLTEIFSKIDSTYS